MADAEATERDIDTAREGYRRVAARASLLFFAVSDLAGVDPMYQFSLGWFRALFTRAMDETPKARGLWVGERCAAPAGLAQGAASRRASRRGDANRPTPLPPCRRRPSRRAARR